MDKRKKGGGGKARLEERLRHGSEVKLKERASPRLHVASGEIVEGGQSRHAGGERGGLQQAELLWGRARAAERLRGGRAVAGGRDCEGGWGD